MKKLKIKSIKKCKESSVVYDLTVDKNHNFFITNKEILTHNCDFCSRNAQAALRNVMETSSRNTRFILTCNFVQKILDPIQSRCDVYEITPPSKTDVALRLKYILDTEQIDYDLNDMGMIVQSTYPDIRRSINMCQRHSVNNVLILDKQSVVENNFMMKVLDTFNTVSNGAECLKQIRQIISDAKVRDFQDAYEFLYDNIEDYAKSNISVAILDIAEAQYRDSFVVDKEINFAALIVNLIKDLKD